MVPIPSFRHLVLLSAGAAIACGGSDPINAGETTVATVTPVRGSVHLGEEEIPLLARAPAGSEIRTAESAITWIQIDRGPSILVDESSQLGILGETELDLKSGRAFFRSEADEIIELSIGELQLHLTDASVSVEHRDAAAVYAVRGEVPYTLGGERGVLRAGELLSLTGNEVTTAAAVLWEDWTGGLARPGPDGGEALGIGTLAARVPDEVGLARWPLVMRRLDVRVRIDRDLAITEVDQVFFNPASETVEGLYRIRVPESAVLGRFAVDRDGELIDGYIKERAQARQQYEAQVYYGSTEDPALLEWDAPGAYRARIYPIAAGESRRIVIRYAEWLGRPASSAPRVYRFPMGGSGDTPAIQEFSLVANLESAGASSIRSSHIARIENNTVRLRESDFRPRSDFVIELIDAGAGSSQVAWQAEHEPPARAPGSPPPANESDERDYWYLPLVLPTNLAGDDVPEGLDLVIITDVSAATEGSHLELGRTFVEALTAHLNSHDRVAIVASDFSLRPLGEEAPSLGPATRDRLDPLLEQLARTSAGGATDIGNVIAEAAALLDPSRPGAIIYVGDALPTVGEMGASELLEQLAKLPSPVRLYGVAVGADANLDLLSVLTRGGGLSMRIDERVEAARAALRVLTHAGRPIANRISVDLGTGLEASFPRTETDVVLGEVLPVIARVRGTPPTTVTVRGHIRGEPFEHSIAIDTKTINDQGDLRLRWASERLRQLLLDGAGREEVADLGTRYGLITPYTSFYVPSRNELAALGNDARELRYATLLDAERAVRPRSSRATVAALLLWPLALGGCGSEDAERAAPPPMPEEEAEEVDMTPRQEQQGAPGSTNEHWASTGAEEPSNEPPASPVVAIPEAREEDTENLARYRTDDRISADELGALGGPPSDVPMEPLAGDGSDATSRSAFSGEGGGSGRGGSVGWNDEGERARATEQTQPAPDPSPAERRDQQAHAVVVGANQRGGRLMPQFGEVALEGTGNGTLTITTQTTTTITFQRHQPQYCSDAARQSVSDREALWQERLAQGSYANDWVQVYRDAQHKCELPTWRDRRALLDLILRRAGSISAMLDVYRLLEWSGARGYLRNAIRRRVRTPEELRLVRDAFGLSSDVEWQMVEEMLARATTPAARIRALRQFIAQYPGNFDLKLRLLEELEQANRLPEAKRLAADLRRDPMSDAGVRTAIGELYLRMNDEAEARRVFSEIVEFAPEDDLARRRLGDLYRAHGWFDDAYRQYQTLAFIRPDSPDVLLLLAQAAAGAGRIDEALRLEQRLIQTAEPGAAAGIARTALLWSSVRYALLRKAASEANDAERLAALKNRMRQGGVLREAGALRVSLIWSHPDAELSLWTAHPRFNLSRPDDIAPEFGIEVFDLDEQETGIYKIEVRRAGRAHVTAVEAQLVMVWNEGREDEMIQIIPLRFQGERTAAAWSIEGRTVAEAQLSAAAGRNP